MNGIEAIVKEAGVFEYGFADTEEIVFSQDVRDMCAANTCRGYGKTWSCPPGIGTLAECRERLQAYKRMLLFSVKYDLEDSFDYEGMQAGMAHFKTVCRRMDGAVRPLLDSYLILSNEGCDLCQKCTYPDAPCRFPDRAHGSIEAYGIFVSELAKKAGIHYINGANTVTYFGALLCSEESFDRLLASVPSPETGK